MELNHLPSGTRRPLGKKFDTGRLRTQPCSDGESRCFCLYESLPRTVDLGGSPGLCGAISPTTAFQSLPCAQSWGSPTTLAPGVLSTDTYGSLLAGSCHGSTRNHGRQAAAGQATRVQEDVLWLPVPGPSAARAGPGDSLLSLC